MSQKTKRLAIVIGNSNYANLEEVPNAIKDAEAVQNALDTLGFEVTIGINRERKQILDCITSIRNTWQHEASEIVLYYSGHGISINGKVYLGPVDATPTLDFIDQHYLGVDVILEYLITYRNNDKSPIIIILDCCRSAFEINNTRRYNQGDPLRGVREDNSIKKANIAILYSTAEGHVASDGNSESDNSAYTKILLKNIMQDCTIEEIQYELIEFFENSNEFRGKQVPWIHQCLYKPYKFHHTRHVTAPPDLSIEPLTANDLVKRRFHGVPHKNNDFINRPGIVADIEVALSEDHSIDAGNILALRGLGGMGKTQLMLHYCYLHRTTYEFIFWLEVDDSVAALDSFLKLAIYLGLDEKSAKEKYEEEKIIEWVCDWLEKRKGWLILLNNVDETMVTKLFKVLPRIGGDIILTTREHISSKKAKIITVGKMDENEALSLLLGTAEINTIDHDGPRYLNAKEIVTELDSMPLAVDLARAYVNSMSTSFKEYLTMFKNQRDILFSQQDEDNSHQYNHSLKTVWQLSFNRIRAQSPLAIELLEICTFLQPELIPTSLFKRQHSVLTLSSHLPLSSTSSEVNWKFLKAVQKAVAVLVKSFFVTRVLDEDINKAEELVNSETDSKGVKAIQEAVAVLAKFSFVTRSLKEDINQVEDPATDVLTIHRLVQKVIYDAMSDEQKIRWTCNLASALNKEIDFSNSYSSLTRTMMNVYLLHIRHFAKMTNINKKTLMSEDLFELMIHTVSYSYDNGIYFGMEELAQFTLSISECIHEPESHSMARSLDCLAKLYQNQGNYAKAEPLYERALVINEKGLGPEHPNTATSLNNLAFLYFNQGNYGKAEPLYERARVIKEKALGPEHPETAMSLNNLASLYFNQGNYAKAGPLHERALVIFEKALGPEHPETARSLNNLALLYFYQGNHAKAEPLYERALAIREKALGLEHPETAISLNNLALLYSDQGNYAKAGPLCERALMINEKELGPEHPSTSASLNNLAGLYLDQGNYAKAELLYERALMIREKALGPEHPDTAMSLNNLALLYSDQGNHAKAKPLCERALMINEKELGPEHSSTAISLGNFAKLYFRQGNYAEAEPLYERALAIFEKTCGPEHSLTALSLNYLAELYSSQGNYAKAEPLYQRALMICEKALGPEHPETVKILTKFHENQSQSNLGKVDS